MSLAADAYLETHVMTASAERLHLMVIEGALRFARRATAALEARDFEKSHEALNRSRACIDDMVVAIRPEQNPDLAMRLKGLFLFAHRNLVQADLEHNPAKVRDAIQILELHRETWVELMVRLRQERSAATPEYDREESTKSWVT